jgi:hypothetical protein
MALHTTTDADAPATPDTRFNVEQFTTAGWAYVFGNLTATRYFWGFPNPAFGPNGFVSATAAPAADYSRFSVSSTSGVGTITFNYRPQSDGLNQWIHYAAVFDANEPNIQNGMKYFVNGSEVGFNTILVNVWNWTVVPSPPKIGFLGANTGVGLPSTNVAIAEIAFWDRILTDAEIYNLGANKWSPRYIPTDQTAYWRLIRQGDQEDLNPNFSDFDWTTTNLITYDSHPSIKWYLNRFDTETPQEHFSDGMRRLRIQENDTDYGAEKYRWQIRIANQTTQYYPYPQDLYTDEPYIDVYFPPFTDMEARVFQVGASNDGVSDEHWGDWQTIAYQQLTSYDKARILSGLDTTTSTETDTGEGAIIEAE